MDDVNSLRCSYARWQDRCKHTILLDSIPLYTRVNRRAVTRLLYHTASLFFFISYIYNVIYEAADPVSGI